MMRLIIGGLFLFSVFWPGLALAQMPFEVLVKREALEKMDTLAVGNNLLLSYSANTKTRALWDISTRQLIALQKIERLEKPYRKNPCFFQFQGQMLFQACPYMGTVEQIDLKTGHVISQEQGWVYGDARWAVSDSHVVYPNQATGFGLHLKNWRTQKSVRSISLTAEPKAVALSKQAVWIGDTNGWVYQQAFNSSKLKVVAQFEASIMALTQQNNQIFVGLENMKTQVLDLETGKCAVFPHCENTSKLKKLQSDYLVGMNNQSICLWDIHSQKLLKTWELQLTGYFNDKPMLDFAVDSDSLYITQGQTIEVLQPESKNRPLKIAEPQQYHQGHYIVEQNLLSIFNQTKLIFNKLGKPYFEPKQTLIHQLNPQFEVDKIQPLNTLNSPYFDQIIALDPYLFFLSYESSEAGFGGLDSSGSFIALKERILNDLDVRKPLEIPPYQIEHQGMHLAIKDLQTGKYLKKVILGVYIYWSAVYKDTEVYYHAGSKLDPVEKIVFLNQLTGQIDKIIPVKLLDFELAVLGKYFIVHTRSDTGQHIVRVLNMSTQTWEDIRFENMRLYKSTEHYLVLYDETSVDDFYILNPELRLSRFHGFFKHLETHLLSWTNNGFLHFMHLQTGEKFPLIPLSTYKNILHNQRHVFIPLSSHHSGFEIWDIHTGQHLINYYLFPTARLMVAPDGAMTGWGNIEAYLDFVVGQKPVSLESLKSQYWRPEYVKKRLTGH